MYSCGQCAIRLADAAGQMRWCLLWLVSRSAAEGRFAEMRNEMQKLNQDLKEKKLEQIYLLYGEEPFLLSSYKKRLKTAITGDDEMNSSYYEGKGIELSEVRSMAETMPFFADHRLIILENSGLMKSAPDGWTAFLDQLPDFTHVIFVETEVDKRSKMYKKVQKIGYAAELNRQKEPELKRWIVGLAGREGMKITAEALELFLRKAGDSMENIRMELEKLIAYCQGEEGITREAVEDVCTEQTENRIFEMIEAVAAGNEKRALNLYYDLLALKEPSMRILFLIARQFNQLMIVKEMAADGAGRDAIASAMKLRPFIAGKLLGQSRSFTRKQLREYVELCVKSEEDVKKGNLNDKLAVELVIVKISRR